jgi:hypothetical protein
MNDKGQDTVYLVTTMREMHHILPVSMFKVSTESL